MKPTAVSGWSRLTTPGKLLKKPLAAASGFSLLQTPRTLDLKRDRKL